MKRQRNGLLILIIGAVGLIAVIGAAIYENVVNTVPPQGFTAQEIAAMDVRMVNVNTATAEELDALPSVTPKIARSIVNYREENGLFSSTDELLNVKGVGKSLYQKIAPYITAEE